jgi:hypothetical protein
MTVLYLYKRESVVVGLMLISALTIYFFTRDSTPMTIRKAPIMYAIISGTMITIIPKTMVRIATNRLIDEAE